MTKIHEFKFPQHRTSRAAEIVFFLTHLFCLSKLKLERLIDPFDEVVTISVHKYNVIMSCLNMTCRQFILETRCQDVGCFYVCFFNFVHSHLFEPDNALLFQGQKSKTSFNKTDLLTHISDLNIFMS